jgi:hypothetical protein
MMVAAEVVEVRMACQSDREPSHCIVHVAKEEAEQVLLALSVAASQLRSAVAKEEAVQRTRVIVAASELNHQYT